MVSKFNLALFEITTRYRLDGPRIESRVQSGLGTHKPPVKWVPKLFSRGKAVEVWG